MGKKLIIKGADFYANAIDTEPTYIYGTIIALRWPSAGTHIGGGPGYASVYFNVTPGQTVKVWTDRTDGSALGFVASTGENVNYVNSRRELAQIGQPVEVSVPNNATYLIVGQVAGNSGKNLFPSIITIDDIPVAVNEYR